LRLNYDGLVPLDVNEMRISNFLLWEATNAELYFTETLWPDFDGDSLGEPVGAFQS
jgi:undecaprenyl diphosphate synthase